MKFRFWGRTSTTGLTEKQAKELQLWRKWKGTRNVGVLDQLIDSYQPVINKIVGRFAGAPLPKEAIEAEAIKQMVGAFNTYDPTKGTALNTHVFGNLKKVQRYISNYQNVGKIPEARVLKIGDFNNTYQQLINKFNREPTTNELADTLHWQPEEVVRMQKELRKDLAIEDLPFISIKEDSKLRNDLYFYYNGLMPDDQLIFEYTTGIYGKNRKSNKEISEIMKIPLSNIKKRQNRIIEEIKTFI